MAQYIPAAFVIVYVIASAMTAIKSRDRMPGLFTRRR
jgi:hypothetical protein